MTFSDILVQLLGILLTAAFTYVLHLSLLRLRRTHAREIYLIWYIYSLLLVMFFGLSIIARITDTHIFGLCGAYENTCFAIYHYLTDYVGEIALVVALTSLAIIPQLLAYLLSGLSGVATAPKFVTAVQTIAVWSLVKFYAGLGGITMEVFLTNLILSRRLNFMDLANAQFVIMTAFGIAALHVSYFDYKSALRERHVSDFKIIDDLLAELHNFFTRHSRSD